MTDLIVALDEPDLERAETLAAELGPRVGALKVGLTLFTAYGPDAIRRITRYGKVFYDAKLHDIPQQIHGAASEIAKLGVWMFTVHASGGPAMLSAAVDACAGTGAVVAGVTVLTSLSAEDLETVGQGSDSESQVLRLASLAHQSGAGAIVCSGAEASAVRRKLGPRPLVVVPGVRPRGSPVRDQARVVTPADAASAGASHIVVGRPITEAPDPVAAAEAVLEELSR